MKLTYFRWWGFSIMEGSGTFNIHISWLCKTHWFFFYICVLGHRWHFILSRVAKYKTEREYIEKHLRDVID